MSVFQTECVGSNPAYLTHCNMGVTELKYTLRPAATIVVWDGTNFEEVRDFVFSYFDLEDNGDGTLSSSALGAPIQLGAGVTPSLGLVDPSDVGVLYQTFSPGSKYTLE